MKRGTRNGDGGGRASRNLGRDGRRKDGRETPALRSRPSAPRGRPGARTVHAQERPNQASGPRHGGRRGRRGASWLRRLQLVTGVIVVVSASLLAAWGLRRYLRSSPRFAIRTVRIDGNHRRTAHQIAERGAIELGANILSIDEHAAAAAIAADPWMASATVHTELPSTVVVTVVEREARALTVLQGKLFLVDADGEVFKARRAGEPQALPIITGLDEQRLLEDREGTAGRLRHALELAADIEAMGLSKRYPLQELHLEVDGAITAVVGSDPVSLRLGMAPYRVKLLKAKRLLAEMRHRKARAAVLFLDNRAHPERVVVRMR